MASTNFTTKPLRLCTLSRDICLLVSRGHIQKNVAAFYMDGSLRIFTIINGQIYLRLVVTLPEVCNSFEIISIDESSTFVPK
jgi:hypothetical protein